MNDIETVKTRLNIVDVIAKYVTLANAGSNFRGLCPFHQEKSPSFMVNPSMQIFKCFGCGKGGDVITFIKEIERTDFSDALQKAADLAGVKLSGKVKKDPEAEKFKKRLFEANELAARFFNHILKTHRIGDKARKYAIKRQLSVKEIEKFNFGYAPDGYENLKQFLLKRGFNEDELVKFGLLVPRGDKTIDKFRNRLLQPLYSLEGDIVGFSGRYLGDNDNAPKYLNSPESIVYKKNESLYSLFHSKESIRKKKFVIIVEGNLDVVSGHRAGSENIVAPLGTAFTINQAKLIKRFSDSVYFCFDNDTAGLNAIIKSIKLVEEVGLDHKVIDLGEFKDPDELICSNIEKWKEVLENPKDTYEYLKQKFSKDIDIGSIDGKTHLKKMLIPVLQSYKDEVKINHYIKDLSLILEVPTDIIGEDVKTGANIPIIRAADFAEEKVDTEILEIKVENFGSAYKLEKSFLALIIQNNDFLHYELNSDFFTDLRLKELAEVIFEVKDFLDESILRTINQDLRDLYSEMILMDLSDIEDKDALMKEMFNRIYIDYLRKQILHLRMQLSKNDEDEDVMGKLNSMTLELNKVMKKPSV